MTVAESKLIASNAPTWVGVGDQEHEFLFGYTKFLVYQHIADIDWYDRQMQPSFMAPLTCRGRELVRMIQKIESKYKECGDLPDTGLLHAAQEGFVQLLFTPSELQRISLVDDIQKIYKSSKDKNA